MEQADAWPHQGSEGAFPKDPPCQSGRRIGSAWTRNDSMRSGVRSVRIDHERFTAQPNSICFIMPGQRVAMEYDHEPSGWILTFSKEFFNRQIGEKLVIRNVVLFSSFGEIPKIVLSPKIGDRVHVIAEMIDELIGSQIPNRESGIASLLKTLLIYCESRCNIRQTSENNANQVHLTSTFKDLVAHYYTEYHRVSDYAEMMNISPKYLNQVVKQVLGVTARSIIQEQLIIHARRDLKFSNDSVKQIAFRLGYAEPFHFSSFFKKKVGCSPSDYRLQ
ncbi:MAG: AraC family transcriptional regulator [Balneolaceae bacterium]|nr:MAG: AraC family transcriptional regulator [Balneolaceae bacterium]